MIRRLVLASAGAGKTHRVVRECLDFNKLKARTLIVTYTRNNQLEINAKYLEFGGRNSDLFKVKGWYTFLLEEIVRPYQTLFFPDRINGVILTSSNPHLRNGYHIPGRAEEIDGAINPLHYLTSSMGLAYTEFLSKLAFRILVKTKGAAVQRLERIYSHIYIDEFQDLAGWDYDVIKQLSKSKTLNICCVGDLRQTIYSTTSKPKKPSTNLDKIAMLEAFGYTRESMAITRRCIQSVYDFADSIHVDEAYEKTSSIVSLPKKFEEHFGVYVVRESNIAKYCNKYSPMVLRHGASSGKNFVNMDVSLMNFGLSKGLGFDRVLICPTLPQKNFLLGKGGALGKELARNVFYVAATRARYSLVFMLPDKAISKSDLSEWEE